MYFIVAAVVVYVIRPLLLLDRSQFVTRLGQYTHIYIVYSIYIFIAYAVYDLNASHTLCKLRK